MDGQGVWRNRHGRFRRKKIIDHFNAAIRRDGEGFYVCQERDDILEKVYFPYEDTAWFAVTVDLGQDPPQLGLNTGRVIDLVPENLYTRNDGLFMVHDDLGLVKFAERALLAVAGCLRGEEDAPLFVLQGREYPLCEK